MTVDGSIPDWLNPVPFGDVGRVQLPGNPQQWDVMSEDQLQQMRKQLLESVIATVVQGVTGEFFPGPFGEALRQLWDWSSELLNAQNLLDAINGEYEGDNLAFIAIEAVFTPIRAVVTALGEPLAKWLTWLWNLFSNVDPASNPAPTGPGADLLVPIFTLIDDVWDDFTTATGNLLQNLFKFLNWLWRRFANIPGDNTPPTGPGFDLLVPIFSFLDDTWDAFTTATGNFLEDVFQFFNWMWRRFANIPGDNTPPTGPGFDLLVPIFSFLDDVWDAFTTATGNLLGDLFDFFNWMWRRFANINDANGNPPTPPTGPGFDLLVPIFSFLDDTWDAFTTATGNVLGNLFQFFNWMWRRFANINDANGNPPTPPTGPGFDLLVPIFSFLDDIWDAFGNALGGLLTFVLDVFSPIANILNGDGGIIGNVIKQVVEFFNGIITTFGSITAGLPSFSDVGEAIADAIATVGNWVFSLINGLTGGLFATILDGLAGIAAWASGIPLIGPIISAMVPPDWRNSIGLPASSLADLASATAESLTTSSVLYTENLVGQIAPESLPPTGSGDVADYKPNLISDPSFRSAATVQEGDGWSWDAATSRTAGAGGSAKVVGNGGVKQMFSNRVAVSPGQEIEVSVYANWTKPSAARPTISVGLRAYNGETVVFTQPLASQPNLVSNSGGWVKLTGTYAIPASTPMTHVRLVMSVQNAPSGTSVWFDEASLRRVSLIKPSLIDGVGATSSTLADDIENSVGSDQFDDLLRAISKKTGYSLADVEATIEDFLDGDSEINGDQIKAGNIAAEFINDLGLTWDSIYTGVKDSAPPKAKDLTSAFDALASWRSVITSAGGASTTAEAIANGAVKRLDAVDKNATELKTYIGLMGADVRKLCVALSIAPTTPATPPGDNPVNFTAVSDNFDRATIGGGWSVSYRDTSGSGALIIPDGSNAFFQVPAALYVYNNTFSAIHGVGSSTEYQRVYCTLGSAPSRPNIGSPGYNDLLGRVANSNRCMVARFYNDINRTVRLFYRSGSLEPDPFLPSNQFGVFNMPSDLTSGSVLEFYVGNKSINDQTKCFVKVGTWSSGIATMNGTQLLAMGKGWGFGGGNGVSILSAAQFAGKVNFWGAQDQ
jgi:hypothetical protein